MFVALIFAALLIGKKEREENNGAHHNYCTWVDLFNPDFPITIFKTKKQKKWEHWMSGLRSQESTSNLE